ncbi:hypothetical protein CkaCkLH20_00223 [Colletotrichum karsti]|uniref:Uncharacterized protein n=1 Tax=Colletotrichum karsti TaxID=1095194 RepID=A0A9P6IGP8_9PEZI|nr:uncharacterized protein CkaCkLH20_00223 [Colletotrichum karsti]KAF9882187.1 hypothetical protein CkaCkLH20_00223 [Colletotrichum karsti]
MADVQSKSGIRSLQEELNEFIAPFDFPEIQIRRRIKILVRDYGDLQGVLTDRSSEDIACYAIDMVLHTLLEEYTEVEPYTGKNTTEDIELEKALLIGTIRWAIEQEKLEGMRPAVKSHFQTQLASLKGALEPVQTLSTSEKEPMSNSDTKVASKPASSSILQKRELSEYKENLNETDAADAEQDELDRKGRPMEEPSEAETSFLHDETRNCSSPKSVEE